MNSGRNCLGVMFGALLYIKQCSKPGALRHRDTRKIGAEVFEELRRVALEEDGEDQMVRESNQ